MTEIGPILGTEPAAHGAPANGAAGRILRGLAANIGGMGVTLVIQLVSVPLLLAAWGVPTYGEWLVLSAVPTYVALSDLSFSYVAGNSMVMLEAEGKRAEAIVLGRRLWSIVTVMTGMAVLAAVIIALVFGRSAGNGAAIPATETQIVLVALFLQVAVGNQYGVLDAWYRTGGHYALGTFMRQLGRLLEFGALMGAVLVGARPGVAAVAFLVASVVGFWVSWIVLRTAVEWSTFALERPHLRTFRELLAPGVAFMAFPIGSALSLQGLTIVVASTLGVAAVVVFSTTRTLTRVVLQVLASISASIWPELSRSIGAGRLDEARTILRRATQLAVALSLLLIVLLGVLGPSIIRSWTHGVVDPPRGLLYILLLVVFCNSVWNTLATALMATNQHRRQAVLYVIGATMAVLGAVPLSSAYGLPGAAAALLVIDAGMVVYVLPAALRVIQDRPGTFLRALLDIRQAMRSARSSPTFGR